MSDASTGSPRVTVLSPSRAFAAKFGGQCSRCPAPVVEGDMIRLMAIESLDHTRRHTVHADCAEAENR